MVHCKAFVPHFIFRGHLFDDQFRVPEDLNMTDLELQSEFQTHNQSFVFSCIIGADLS